MPFVFKPRPSRYFQTDTYRCTKKKQTCNEKYIREEALVEQMKSVIQKVSIPDDWADNMLAELDREKASIQNEGVSFVQNLKTRKMEVEQKIDRLLDIYIEAGLAKEEYQKKKAKLLNEKADIEQEIRDFEQKGNNWLEPMREVILLSSQAKNSFVARRQNANPRISQKCRLELYAEFKTA